MGWSSSKDEQTVGSRLISMPLNHEYLDSMYAVTSFENKLRYSVIVPVTTMFSSGL